MSVTSPPTDPRTLSVSENTRVRLPLVFLFALISAVGSGTFMWATQRSAADRTAEKVTDHAAALTDHEKRLKELERAATAVEVIKTDIRWIREELQRRRAEPQR